MILFDKLAINKIFVGVFNSGIGEAETSLNSPSMDKCACYTNTKLVL
jgi:hypothetical protein